MSIERYKMLTTSYVHIKHSSKLRVIIFISLSWFLPFSTWIPVIVIFRGINGIRTVERCHFPGTYRISIIMAQRKLYFYFYLADAYVVLCLSVILYHLPLICMVTFYTKLIIHIKSSSLNYLSNQTLNETKNGSSIKRTPCKVNQRFTLNEPSYHDYIYNQLYALNRKSINTISKNCTKFYLNNSPTELSISNNFLQHKKSGSMNSLNGKLCCCFCCSFLQEQRVDEEFSPRRNSNPRRNSVNNAISINFRKCNLSIPADNISLSSEKNRIENRAFNNNDNDLEDNRGSSKTKSKTSRKMSFGEFRVQKRNSTLKSTKSRLSTISFKRNVIFKNKSNSLCQTQNTIDQNFDNFENFNYQNLRIKRNRKAARMLGILVAAFTICWLPYVVIYPLSQFYPNVLPEYINAIIWWLGYLNSAINPFLYVYSNRNIRRSVRNLFSKRFFSLFCRSKSRRSSLTQNLSRRISFARNQ